MSNIQKQIETIYNAKCEGKLDSGIDKCNCFLHSYSNNVNNGDEFKNLKPFIKFVEYRRTYKTKNINISELKKYAKEFVSDKLNFIDVNF